MTDYLQGQPVHIHLHHHSIDEKEYRQNISGLAYYQGHLILGSDEGSTVWLAKQLDENSPHHFTLQKQTLQLLAEDHHELDVEAIHCLKDTCYILGSHSLKRKKVKGDVTQEKNRKRMLKVTMDKNRYQIFKVKLSKNPTAFTSSSKSFSIHNSIKKDPLLERFLNIPSKENGIDIEALAVDQDHVYLGFRSPILRQNFVPIWVTSHHFGSSYELRFVDLKGHGIRDMVAVKNGILLLTGPGNDAVDDFCVYFWDKKDGIPGSDVKVYPPTLLGKIKSDSHHAKAEAITLLEETNQKYQVLVGFDGPDYGAPLIYHLDKN